jgi:hypothetical protein
MKCDNLNICFSSGNGRDWDEGDKEYEDVDEDYDSSEDEQSDAPKREDENNIYKDMEMHSRYRNLTILLIKIYF